MAFSMIAALASATTVEEAEHHFTNPEFQAAWERKQAMDKSARTAQLANLLTSMVAAVENDKAGNKTVIRHARSIEREAKRRLDRVDRAFAFAEATSNFVPLGSELGLTPRHMGFTQEQYELFMQLNHIPEDWTPLERSS